MAKLRTYGHNKTIHNTTHLDIETNSKGEVVGVWFRCQPLPFKQYKVSKERSNEMRDCYTKMGNIKLHAVVLENQKVEENKMTNKFTVLSKIIGWNRFWKFFLCNPMEHYSAKGE